MDLSFLNEEQREAVLHTEGPLAVLAAAGAGKSKLLTCKVAQLIEMGVEPSSILATTFTNKAAKVIKKRVVGMCGKEAEFVHMSTLHSFCYKILMKIYKREGKPRPTLIKDYEKFYFLLETRKKLDLYSLDIKQLTQSINYWKLHEVLPSHLKNHPDYDNLVGQGFSDKNNRYLAAIELYQLYQIHLKDNNKIDFSDMLLLPVNYLKRNPSVADKIGEKIKYILVDEFQDTNHISYEFYKLICKSKNITVVGDSRQAIYSFQGSASHFFDKFIEEYSARRIDLNKNYRSKSEIISLGNKLSKRISQNNADTVATKSSGANVNIYASDCEMQELISTTDKIESLIHSGVEHKDIAILYRVNSQAIPFIDLFIQKKIPYYCHSDLNFYNKKEIAVICNYIKLIFEPSNLKVDGFIDVINNPMLFINNGVARSVYKQHKNSYQAYRYGDFKNKRAMETIAKNCSLIDDIRMNPELQKTSTIVEYILHQFGYLDHLKKEYGIAEKTNDKSDCADGDSILNVEILRNIARKIEDPVEFVEYIEEMKSVVKKKNKKGGVNLLTIHASKGMEFKHVFVVGMCSRMMPYLKSHGDMEQLREERRIAYVAVTRAEESLYLSVVNGTYGIQKVTPSPYIAEMGLKIDEHFYY